MGNFLDFFCLCFESPPFGHPLKRGAGRIRRPALRQIRLTQLSKMLCVDSKPRLAQLQFLLLAQPIPNQLALFLDILGNAVGILANVAVQYPNYC